MESLLEKGKRTRLSLTPSKGRDRLFLVGFAETEGVGFFTFGEEAKGFGEADWEEDSFLFDPVTERRSRFV